MTVEAPPNAPTAEDQQPAAPPRGSRQPSQGDMHTIYDEKIERLNKDLNAERAKVALLTKDHAAATQELTGLKVEKGKRSALDAALEGLGDDFVIEDLPTLKKSVDRLTYDESTISGDINNLITLAKKPKKAGAVQLPIPGQPNNGGNGSQSIPDKKATEYSDMELDAMYRSDPEKYKRINDERIAALRGQTLFKL